MILVTAAAVRTRDGSIYEGLTHHDIRLMGGVSGEVGFILTDGRFVGRVQAARIAFDAGQAPRSVLYQVTGLSSSNLIHNYPPVEPAPTTETK